MSAVTGFVFYHGRSMLNGERDIVAIATLRSENPKTGDMVQTWIMSADEEPHRAVADGHDECVCGDCPLRPANNGGCYVMTGHAPLQVYRAWLRGTYPDYTYDPVGVRMAMRGRVLRLGSYGDPAAVPEMSWRRLMQWGAVQVWTGYTHQWRRPDAAWLQGYCMASTETVREYRVAIAMGWTPFHTGAVGSSPVDGALVCPAMNGGVHCIDCLRCNGQGRPVWIEAHGSGARYITDDEEVRV